MRKVSNRLFMNAIQDGETIHGSLRATQTLSQGYNVTTGAWSPSWKSDDLTNNPRIYPVILRGATNTVPQTDFQWLYNGSAITFSTTADDDGYYPAVLDGRFKLDRNYIVPGMTGITVPALIIADNLASAANLDMDTITFKGSVEISGTSLPVSMSLDVTLVEMQASGYLGQINFKDGISVISAKDGEVEMVPSLYNGGNVSEFTVKWYCNGELVTSIDGDIFLTGKNLTVKEAAVVDSMAVTCEFYVGDGSGGTSLVDTQIATVDDIQDPEYMWASYYITDQSGAGINGTSATLHPGQSVTWRVWMGTADSTTTRDTAYTKYTVLLYDAHKVKMEKTAIADLASRTQEDDGYIEIPYNTDNKDWEFTVTWQEIFDASGNIEAIVVAQ